MITHKNNSMSVLNDLKSPSALIRITILLWSVLLISACSSKKDALNQDELLSQAVEDLYTKAKSALDRGNYVFAIQNYQRLEAAFPYGEFTEQAKLDMIFAFDKTGQIEKAVEAAENFIKLYPTHKNVDYAYYMKGVASFEKKVGAVDKFIKGGKKSIRDPKPYRDSQKAFEELIKRYPNSIYADDAKQRIVYIRRGQSL